MTTTTTTTTKGEPVEAMDSSRELRRDVVLSLKWLRLGEISWVPAGRTEAQTYEYVERTTRLEGSRIDGVDVVTYYHRRGQETALVLILNYRPPVAAYSIEFPAGLVDAGESLTESGRRELLEETGLAGTIRPPPFPRDTPGMLEGYPIVSSCPWIGEENFAIVEADVDGDAPENSQPKQQLEAAEDIRVEIVPLSQVPAFLERHVRSGAVVPSHVYCLTRTLDPAAQRRGTKG